MVDWAGIFEGNDMILLHVPSRGLPPCSRSNCPSISIVPSAAVPLLQTSRTYTFELTLRDTLTCVSEKIEEK
jgi:hypothetical protein